MGFGASIKTIIGDAGNPLGLPGVNDPLAGGQDNLSFQFPLSFGTTVNDLANVLNVPLGDILAINPGLQAGSSLHLSQVIDLPPAHIGSIAQSLSSLGGGSSDLAPARMDLTLPANAPPQSYATPVSSGSVNVMPSSAQATQDVINTASAVLNRVFPSAVATPARMSDPIAASSPSTRLLPQRDDPVAAMARQVASTPAQASTLRTMPVAGDDVAPAGTATTLADSRDAATTAFSRDAVVAVRASQVRLRDSDSIPPPPSMPGAARTEVVLPSVQSNPLASMPAYANWTPVPIPGDANQAKLEILALLAAQMGSAHATSGPVAQQVPAFVDPQAVAAQAAAMRGTRVVDLGAGRSLEFTLVSDRMRRIDAIGRDEQAATRRTGDGLDAKVGDAQPQEETQQADDDRRDGERRKQAAIAAMRRRRRPRSTRCRYRRGARATPSSTPGRYPARVDLAEFRSRLPPRYLWNWPQEP
ncbi:hypothetical protein [Dyella sp.]|uniref:hypothetical protein n=1 Tax=Dyella sp. TaxID=1869338 RepID=UPI002ED4F533